MHGITIESPAKCIFVWIRSIYVLVTFTKSDSYCDSKCLRRKRYYFIPCNYSGQYLEGLFLEAIEVTRQSALRIVVVSFHDHMGHFLPGKIKINTIWNIKWRFITTGRRLKAHCKIPISHFVIDNQFDMFRGIYTQYTTLTMPYLEVHHHLNVNTDAAPGHERDGVTK